METTSHPMQKGGVYFVEWTDGTLRAPFSMIARYQEFAKGELFFDFGTLGGIAKLDARMLLSIYKMPSDSKLRAAKRGILPPVLGVLVWNRETVLKELDPSSETRRTYKVVVGNNSADEMLRIFWPLTRLGAFRVSPIVLYIEVQDAGRAIEIEGLKHPNIEIKDVTGTGWHV